MKAFAGHIGICFLLISTLLHSEERVLKNGLRVILSQSRSPVTSAVIMIKTGEADSPPFLAALTTRMLLRGTEIRDSRQIYLELETAGGKLGSNTLLTFSEIHVQAPSENFQGCFDILCECAARASFDSSEIARIHDSPDEEGKSKKGIWTDAPLRNMLFNGSNLARDFSQRTETYTQKEILDFYRANFVPANMVIAVSGQFDRRAVYKTLLANWKDPAGKPAGRNAPEPPGEQDTTETLLWHDQTRDWAYIGFVAPSFSGKRYDETFFLSTALGEGSAAYLPKQLASENNTELDVRTYYHCEPFIGYFTFIIHTPSGQGRSTAKRILADLEKIKKQGLPLEDFEIAKRRVKSKIAIQSQYTIQNALFGAQASASGNGAMTYSDFEDRLDMLALPQIQQAAQELFARPSVVILRARRESSP